MSTDKTDTPRLNTEAVVARRTHDDDLRTVADAWRAEVATVTARAETAEQALAAEREAHAALRGRIEAMGALLYEGYGFVADSRPGETIWLDTVDAQLWPPDPELSTGGGS